MAECVFCGIVSGKIPSDIIHRDASVIAFRDINPMAPVHDLIIPIRHIDSLDETTDSDLLGHMVVVATALARQENVSATGYRLVINCGKGGGQVVPHLHLHLLGGKQLSSQLG